KVEREESRPQRCPQQAQEQKHALVAEALVAVMQDEPELQVDENKEERKSAEALQDYGVLVGKVTCKKEPVQAYCTDAKQQHRAFLFRGGKEFLSFSLDTVFDVNSIVAEVLFAILRDEVKYVHTDADLLTLEKAAKGKKDIVLGHVRSLGTQEHRSLMETAYVYGSKYQFILITGGPVLKQLGVNESSQLSRVWFVHCRVHGTVTTPVTSERCPLTRMRTALSTLSLHTFLQLMEAPLVVFTFHQKKLEWLLF
uniref:Thioredoxin domain containing 16 n=1 Tax=Xiphophorus couchianus TaxID=32473 RepID=A0A3B5MUU7_9TELE